MKNGRTIRIWFRWVKQAILHTNRYHGYIIRVLDDWVVRSSGLCGVNPSYCAAVQIWAETGGSGHRKQIVNLAKIFEPDS